MRTTIDLDDEMAEEIERTVSLVREKRATVLRLALRTGLPLVASRFQSPRPEGYFADAYKDTRRSAFETTMAQATKQKPER